ncbi:hypothetical protein DUNSADRAFT_6172 [Dunaliella salina]|uniref:Uncharacterized protein n=1 Tax=Dunaliella salina TaxID=3046 RepID=A0ABQ7GNV5_DUNSA|nr:hypothetical protein DUNSADRAFT_6172 [Dunaliella salina]|eukprot:KAF5836295.1 hypothetical protein DUNSADRAFT_6172 [Dunaliella salina]
MRARTPPPLPLLFHFSHFPAPPDGSADSVLECEYKAAKAESAEAEAKSRVAVAQSAVMLVQRVQDIFVEAGLLSEGSGGVVGVPSLGAIAAEAVANGSSAGGGGNGGGGAAAAGNSGGADGPSRSAPAAPAHATPPSGNGAGPSTQAAALWRSCLSEHPTAAAPGIRGPEAKEAARQVLKGPGRCIPGHLVRLPPNVPLGLVLVAERLSGTPLLLRDAAGWVASVGFGESKLWGMQGLWV